MIKDIIAENSRISHGKLSRYVCEALDWQSSNGKLKEMSCRVALLKLERKGIITLPHIYEKPDVEKRVAIEDRITEYQKAECDLSELGQIEIVKTGSRYSKSYERWKEMMNRAHYLGSGPLCGQQIKYLVESEHYGYIGVDSQEK